MQKREEQLSSLLDNALSDEELSSFMQDLKRDPIEDTQTAQRYHLIGDAMRDELDVTSFMDVSATVQRAIEHEPELNESIVSPQHKTFNLLSLVSTWTKPLTGIAVAASVAMVTFITFNNVQNVDDSTQSSGLVQSSSIERVDVEISNNVQVASTLKIVKKEELKNKDEENKNARK